MALPSYVGRYEVRDEIARGGFGIVVQAWDEELESLVALKILHQELAEDPDLLRWFVEEARLLRRIRSPHVVTVHDVGRLNDGRPYFVMDFADRGTLAPRLESREGLYRPDPQSIMALVDAVADGVSALHEAGIIHRDVKPDNILFQVARRGSTDLDERPAKDAGTSRALIQADERILLGDLGIAKDLFKRGKHPTIVGGTPLYRAPEQTDEHSEITVASDIYAATALLWHVVTGQRPPEANRIAGRLDTLTDSWHEVMTQGMALAPGDRYVSIDSWRSAVHQALAQVIADGKGGFATEAVPITSPCPYKGLAAYQPEDARFFAGRETLTDELVRRIHLHQVLVVGGPSGSGKSSLVRAGLIPALKAGALPGSENWRLALFTPGRDPIAELHFQVVRTLPDGHSAVSLADLVAHPTMARHLGGTNGSDDSLVLCIDQFEELFTLAPESRRQIFVTALSAMTDPADSKTRLVIAVRADFYGNCAQIPWLAERITHNQVLVGPMSGPELRRAITEPARRASLYLERNLVDAVVDEAGGEAGSLPLVAHALVETWVRRQGNALTLEGFREAGGVAGAISQTADATYELHFNEAERETAKRLFLRLVNPGEETADTRRLLVRSEVEHSPNPDVMHRVVECLTEARLLTLDDATIQIAHEALLRIWPRLRGWIEESRNDLHTRQRISRAAEEWDTEGRDLDLLYRGTPLLSAQEWLETNPDQLGEIEHAFLEASAEAKTRAERVSAERQLRSRKFRRIAVALLSFLAVGATSASVIAFLAFRDAKRNEGLAELATIEAHERFAGALGAAAHGLVQSDPLLSLALAAEAVARAEVGPPGFDARSTMVSARRVLAQSRPFLVGSPITASDVLAIAVGPDGSLVAAAKRDGGIDLVDTLSRRRVGPGLRGHVGAVRDLAFGPLGRQLTSVGADGTIRLWNVGGGLAGRGRIIGRTEDIVLGASFDPRGSMVASANGDGSVGLWGVGSDAPPVPALVDQALAFNVVGFSPDGRGVVASRSDGAIFAWSLPSRTQLFEPIRDAHNSHLLGLAFSPSGNYLATASTDGTSTLIAYPSGRPLGSVFGQEDDIRVVLFGADDDTLIGASADGALKLWGTQKQKPIGSSPRGHSQAIIDADLSGTRKLLATLGQDQLIRLWSLDTRYPMAATLQVAGVAAKGVAFSAGGKWLASGDDQGVVQVWDLETNESPRMLYGHGHQVWALAFSPNTSQLASGDRSGMIHLWDAANAELRTAFSAHDGAVWSLGFTPDGSKLVTTSDTGARLWDVGTGKLIANWEPENGRITRSALSPNGELLATASTDGKVRFWHLGQVDTMNDIAVDDDVVWSVAFSPDGNTLATGSSDEVVALWDVNSGRQLAALTGHKGGATDVAYLGDGATVVAVDRSGKLHFWDAKSGRSLAEAWQGHSAASWRIAVHPDGERFATTGDDGKVRVWDALSVASACEIGGAAFDAVRQRQYLGESERTVACAAAPRASSDPTNSAPAED